MLSFALFQGGILLWVWCSRVEVRVGWYFDFKKRKLDTVGFVCKKRKLGTVIIIIILNKKEFVMMTEI